MDWWWSVPAAAGLSMLGALYRSRNPRMSGREGGPAFETFYDVRECLRGGVTPILPEGWQYWRCELLRGAGRQDATGAGQQNITKLKVGDRVWLSLDQDCRQPNVAKASSREGFLGFAKVGPGCRQAIVAGQIAAFVQGIDDIVKGQPSVELLVLQSRVPLESSKRVPHDGRLGSDQAVERTAEAEAEARGNLEQSGAAKTRGRGK